MLQFWRMKRPFLFLLLSAGFLLAQAPAPEVEITAEPHHHLKISNDQIRAYYVEVAPREETLTHWHRHDYFAISLGPAEISNAVKGKPVTDVKFVEGETRFTPGTFAHTVRDISEQPFRNVTVELMQDEALRNTQAKWDEERGLDILPGGTRDIVFVKDGVRVTEFELQPGGMVPMHHHAGPHLLVAISDFDLRNDLPGKGAAAEHFKSGESKWFTGNYSHMITNTGKEAGRFVTLEFP